VIATNKPPTGETDDNADLGLSMHPNTSKYREPLKDDSPPELVFYDGVSGNTFSVLVTQDIVPRLHPVQDQKNTRTTGDIGYRGEGPPGLEIKDWIKRSTENRDAGEWTSDEMTIDYPAEIVAKSVDSHSSPGSDGSHSSMSSDSSWSRNTEDRELEVQRLMYLITKILGLPPRDFVDSARVFYDGAGKFIGAPLIEFVTISELLDINYNTPQETRSELEAFLLTGLKYLPATRITAEEALKLAWLK
jgi:hypothetical protein